MKKRIGLSILSLVLLLSLIPFGASSEAATVYKGRLKMLHILRQP